MLKVETIHTNEQSREGPSQVAAPRIWDTSHRWLTIGLVLTVVGAAFEALAVATILPLTSRDLGGLQLYGWAFSAFMLTNLIGVTVAGGEADRLGPARPFLVGVALFVLGLLVSGFAATMPMLIVGRAVQGLGAGVIGSISYIAIARGYPSELKPQMLAVLSSAWVIPGLIGPGLAAVVAEIVGWRWVFLGLVPVMVGAGGLALHGLRSLDGNPAAPPDWRRALAAVGLALGAGLLLTGIGVEGVLPRVGLIAGGLIVAVPALQYLLPPGTLWAAAALPAAIVVSGLLNMAFFGVDAFVPLALTTVRGQSTTSAGLALTAATVTWTTGAWLQARLAPIRGRRQLVWAGLVLTALGIVATAALLHPLVPAALAPLAWALAGLGMGVAYSTLSLVVLEHAQDGQEGRATAGLQLMNMLGSAIGTGIGGAFIAHSSTTSGTGSGVLRQDLLMLAVVGLAVLAAYRLPTRSAVTDDGVTSDPPSARDE
ncbi:MAG TPA: MFS transporter [Herpetosiphonaceae bacterium]